MARVLDALGDHGHAEAAAELDDAAHDRQVPRVGQPLHERAVDLDLAHRQPAQVRQAGVAGAEVVERQADPELGEPAQRAGRA